MLNEVRKKLGELIRLERERQEVGVDEMAERLKMTSAHIEAIETGDASVLPSDVYFELFAKGYAEALGIDYSRTIDAIEESLQEIAPAKPPGAKRKAASPPTEEGEAAPEIDESIAANNALIKKGLTIFGLIVVIFVLFLVVNWLFCNGEEKIGTIPAEESTEEVSSQPPEKKATVDDSPDAAFTNYDWNVRLPDKPEKLRLKLITKQESWSTVIADGDTVLFRNLMPGRIYEVEADYRMTVSVGIPRAVDIELNGQPADLRDPDSRRISRVHINQTNVSSILNQAAATTTESGSDAAWNEFESPVESPEENPTANQGEQDES
ncbi:MAG: helix-turn-helix domain-containing protein [candidate division Zixibacteria bacterium]|nr:helix-turn-helix domain-containing protein [candidate division Zixibacteria bacterium]